MEFNEYQHKALRTLAPSSGGENKLTQLTCAGLGLAGESGEFADHVKKLLFHGQGLTEARRDKMIKELGDILWYVAIGADALGIELSDVAVLNIVKLEARHPEGWDASYHEQRRKDD